MPPGPSLSPHHDDIAARNLFCALGLPGTERLDCFGLLSTLDRWASRVGSETDRLAHLYHRQPELYDLSFSRFRMEVLTTILQRDFHVHYRQPLIDMPDHEFFSRPEHLFLHGVTGGVGGTCSSLPVAFAAVGRRLGYPLRLVRAFQHFFLRWDEPGGEQFNIECTSRGFVSFPDDYYLAWPKAMTRRQAEERGLLRSLTKEEETACFFAQRAICFFENGNMMDAALSFAAAADFDPRDRENIDGLNRALAMWDRQQQPRLVPNFPPMRIHPRRGRFARVPFDLQVDIGLLMARDILLDDSEAERRFWGPMRRDPTIRPTRVPAMIEVDYNGPSGREITVTWHDRLPNNFKANATTN